MNAPSSPDAIQCLAVPLERVVPLRHEVLRPGLPRETAIFPGDDLPTTTHFAATLNDCVVCCATLMRSPWQGGDALQLRGMATRPAFRGRGIGAALLRFIDAAVLARSDWPATLWCNARVAAIPFYEKSGWAVASDEFQIEGVGPHRRMVKRLARP